MERQGAGSRNATQRPEHGGGWSFQRLLHWSQSARTKWIAGEL